MIPEKVRTKQELEEAVELGKLRLQEKLLEANLTYFDSFVDPREPLWDSEEFWMPMASEEAVPPNLDNRKHGEVLPIYLTWMGLKVLRDQSRRLLAYNEFAINAVENRVSYIVGKGFGYEVVRKGGQQSEDDPLAAQAMDLLERFRHLNAWGEMEQEIVRRCDRDGECFLRFFPQTDGPCVVRVIEPEHVKPPRGDQDKRSFGVQSAEQDVEAVQGFWVVECPDSDPVFVPADEILHIKINVDRNAKRGLPTLVPVRKNLERAEKLLRNMSLLAQVQATFALIRKHANTSAAAVQAWQQGQSDLAIDSPLGGRTNYLQMLQPGRIVDAPANIEYIFPAAGVDASAYVSILQAELRAVASRLVLPEYMLTTDASNNNMASSLVAEAPAVKNFERWQAFYARAFGDGCYGGEVKSGVMWRVLRYAVEAGILPGEVLTELEILAEGPSLVVRDRAKETARARQLSEAGILSDATWAKWEGLDLEQEQSQGAGREEEDADGQDPFGDRPSGSPSDPWAGFSRALQEACVPNKIGKGYHDDQTGHPCSKGGKPPAAPKRRARAKRQPGLMQRGRKAAKAGLKVANKTRKRVVKALVRHGRRLAKAGKKVTKRLGKALWRQVPKRYQRPLVRAYGVAKAVEHKAMLGFSKGKAIAVEAARQRGLDAAHAERVGRVLAITDQVLAWTVNMPATTALTGSVAAGKVASFLPIASLAYIGYSTVRNPFATMRAARQVLARKAVHEALLEAESGFSREDVGHLLEWFGSVRDQDWAEAVLCAALDQTGDLGSAFEVASRAIANQHTQPEDDGEWWSLDTPLAREEVPESAGFTGVITDSLGRRQYYQDGKHVAGPTEDQKRKIEAEGRHHLLPDAHGSAKGGKSARRIVRGEYTLGRGRSLDAAKGKAFLEKGGKLRVDSSAVKAVEYDPKRQSMTVHWSDGTSHQYLEVTRHEAESFLHAESKGAWINQNLKGVGYKEAVASGRKGLSKPHPFEKVSGKPQTKPKAAATNAMPVAGRTGRLNQNVAEGNQVVVAYALGSAFSNLPGNWPMDVQRFDGKFAAEGLECKTLLESRTGSVHMDKAAFIRKDYWQQGYLLIPVRDYDQATHGKAYGDETLDAERGGTVKYKVVRDPLAHSDVFKGKPRPVHMCVVDHREEWSQVLGGKGDPDERGWGRRQVYYGRGFGSVQIGGGGPPPLVCCDTPAAYKHLMSLPDDEVQRIAEQHQYGAKSYPSGAAVPQRVKGLPVRDAAAHHHTDMMRWKSKVIRAKVRLWNGVERQDRAEKRVKAIRQRLKSLGEPTTQLGRERKQKLEFAANRAENALKHSIPASMEKARAYQQEYQAKLEKGVKKWDNIERGLATNHPLKGTRF